MGKVKFGASHFEYGVVENDLVAKTSTLPGLTSVNMELTNEIKSLAADDGPYVTVSGGISEAKLTVEMWDITSEAKKDWFGIDIKKGVEIYKKDLVPNDIAVMFKTKDENGKGIYVGMLKGKFSLPGVDSKTVDGTPDPTADKTEGTFSPRGDADHGLMVMIGRESAEDFDYESFHKAVFPTTEEDVKALDNPKE